jgi:hypothetical protein
MFNNLLRAVAETAKLPIDIAADVVTMGGMLTDKDEPYTVRRIKKAYRSLDDV